MKEVQDLKFVCKLCNKKYPCGKSLGGHMRSHVLTNSAEFEEKIEPQLEKLQSWNRENQYQSKFELGGNSGYGLRENPKKTWRAVDSTSPLPQERVCQQCGKVFQSLKALCGHMACHSEKDKGTSYSDTEAEEELRLRTRSKTKRYKRIVVKSSVCLVNDNTINNGSSCVSEIDNEQDQEEIAKCLMMLSRDSWNCVTSFIESSDNNSVVLETKSSSTDMRFARKDGLKCVYNQDETPRTKEKVDRDLKLSVLNAEAESENSDSAYFLDENTTVESDVSFDGFHRNGNSKWSTSKMSDTVWCDESGTDKGKGLNRTKRYPTASRSEYDYYRIASNSDKCESRKRAKNSSYNPEIENESFKKKYECLNCKKNFSSYQALGGHRPCHKKTNACIESTNGTGENSVDAADHDNKHRETLSSRKSASAEKKIKPKKFKGHECPFCDRIFKSGQALGGHKRSHFIVSTAQNMNQSSPVKKDVDDLLDLNLPAPVEVEDDEHAHLVSW
ncbi:zinc finger protein ZAT4-like [Nicotiana tomentosiformis]|uniref:zinc finger protein ZAT4-like n=1 Tax=Nicotiana tomentosiformis TaxID=4098 RepID=UPI00051B77D9|nr:zinc finger protein ZAT4-like [Nicotiana tomentosiformis]